MVKYRKKKNENSTGSKRSLSMNQKIVMAILSLLLVIGFARIAYSVYLMIKDFEDAMTSMVFNGVIAGFCLLILIVIIMIAFAVVSIMKTSRKHLIIITSFVIVAGIIACLTMNTMFGIAIAGGILAIVLISGAVNELKRWKWLKITINCLTILFLLAGLAGIGVAGWFVNYIVENAPEFDKSKLYRSQTTVIYDNANAKIAEIGTEMREIITYNQMSEALIDSIVAVEDSRYFQHNGFDAARFGKATVLQLAGKSDAGGASTLTMQVAKNVYTDGKIVEGTDGIIRKFTDIYLSSFKIEKEFSKQEIMEFYVNIHFLGSNANGVEQAAMTYFGKHAADLTLAEASAIAGVFQAPTSFDLFRNPTAAEKRRETVLNLMYEHGYITFDEANLANAIPIASLLRESTGSSEKYQSYLNLVIDEAIDKYGINPYNVSAKIYTNMNASKQEKLDDIFSGKTYNWENPVVQAGVAAVDVWTGKVIAISDGRDRDVRGHSFARDSKRQVGSSAKPLFDYAPGIEYNNWSTAKIFVDDPTNYGSGQPMRNSDGQFYGPLTLRQSLGLSRNVPALKAFRQVENKKIVEFVTKLGLHPEVSNGYLHEAHSVGAYNGSNPLEMAAAYAAFANGGYYYEPYAISKIVFRDTNEVFTHEDERVKVMSDSTAFMVTDVLKWAVTDGLSIVARVPGVNVAAKTGTTNYPPEIITKCRFTSGINDAWVVGYDPDIAMGIWYGYEPVNCNYQTSPNAAYYQRQGLWGSIGAFMFDKNGKDFKVPNSVAKIGVEVGTDKLAGPNTPLDKIIYEWFKVGTEPTEVSTVYNKLPNVGNLNAMYNPSNLMVNLSWNALDAPEYAGDNYGAFGYKVYKGDTYLGFTKDPKFSISNITDPNGTYKVVTSFQNYSDNSSSGSTYTLSYKIVIDYSSELAAPPTSNYTIADIVQPTKSDVIVYKDSVDVTLDTSTTINITIKDTATDSTITTIDSVGEYLVTYSIKCGPHTNTLTRTITVN